jgi:hypothetical protein
MTATDGAADSNGSTNNESFAKTYINPLGLTHPQGKKNTLWIFFVPEFLRTGVNRG